jgi:hypothetical protein
MPSPFPGMDPYLEGSEWVSVHAELSSEIARQLAPLPRPKYVARAIRRFVTEVPDDIVIATSDIYPCPPDIPLDDAAAAWARESLHAAGRLPRTETNE